MWQQRNYNIIISIYDINEILPLDSNYFDAMSIEAKNTFLEEFFEKISLGFCDGERQRHQQRQRDRERDREKGTLRKTEGAIKRDTEIETERETHRHTETTSGGGRPVQSEDVRKQLNT